MSEPSVPSESAARTSHRTPESRLFFGRFGLRAGFGILIFVCVAYVLTAIGAVSGLLVSGQAERAQAAYSKSHSPTEAIQHIEFTPGFVLASEGVQFVGLLGFCWLLSRAERRPQRYYGIGPLRVHDALAGVVWGIVSMSALVWLLKARGLIVFDAQALHGTAILGFGLFWLVACIVVGFLEEYLFRGYMQYTLMRGVWGVAERIAPRATKRTAFWIAATIMSLAFAGLHLMNGGENVFGIFNVFFIGMVFSYALWRTGSLWWGIGYHALWDYMQGFTFGVPDSGGISVGRLFITHPQGSRLLSGGTDGPEGSVYSVVAVVLTIFVIRFTTKRGAYPPPEPLPFGEHTLDASVIDPA
jgi:hypothetical protein